MKYLALIYSEEQDPSTVDPQEWEGVMAAYNRFTEEIQASGVSLGAEALQPTSTATTVRVREGKTMTTDGPFAETREALGGYYILQCQDLDEAIEWAAKLPGSWRGSVELRPIMEFSPEQQQVGLG
ncbi:YciI family protein [soil metagenome]